MFIVLYKIFFSDHVEFIFSQKFHYPIIIIIMDEGKIGNPQTVYCTTNIHIIENFICDTKPID